jgi:hypothetical protein
MTTASEDVEDAEDADEQAERRTFIFYTKDPISYVLKLNAADRRIKRTRTSSIPQYSYDIVTLMGPCRTEADARLMKALWDFKSRAVIPRAVWAESLARKFHMGICHQAKVMLPMKRFDVVHRDDAIYLYPKAQHAE